MSAAKVDLKAMEAALAKLDKRIKANADQDKSTLAAMERINQQLLSTIDKNSSDFQAVSGHRITSYNVCYTKLLRPIPASRSLVTASSRSTLTL